MSVLGSVTCNGVVFIWAWWVFGSRRLTARFCTGCHFDYASQRIEPREQIGVSFPPWRLTWPELRVNLLKRLPLRFQIRLSVMVSRIQLRMPQPASNHSDIHASRDEVDSGRVPKDMRRHSLLGNGGHSFRRVLDVLA